MTVKVRVGGLRRVITPRLVLEPLIQKYGRGTFLVIQQLFSPPVAKGSSADVSLARRQGTKTGPRK